MLVSLLEITRTRSNCCFIFYLYLPMCIHPSYTRMFMCVQAYLQAFVVWAPKHATPSEKSHQHCGRNCWYIALCICCSYIYVNTYTRVYLYIYIITRQMQPLWSYFYLGRLPHYNLLRFGCFSVYRTIEIAGRRYSYKQGDQSGNTLINIHSSAL